MLRAAAVVERMGVPTASIIGSGFLKQAEVIVKGLGVALGIGVYPGAPMLDSDVELKRKVEEVLAPGLLKALIGDEPVEADSAIEPEPGTVVFSGDYDAVQEHFYKNLWTDGLPVTPPTRERVDAFLKFTDRQPEDVLRVIPQEGREASILSIAVNAVMAGCRPEYMPILLAVVEVICTPEYKIEDAGSTPGWESLITLSGPMIKALGFNSGQGVMRVGRQPNTSIGRFLRMFIRNVAGFTHGPEGADKGSIGQSFLVALAENEDAVAELGWQPYSVDRGFKAGDNVVTVQSVVAISAPAYSQSERAEEHAALLADVIGERACGYWTAIGMCYANWHPLIILGPSIAKVFVQDGWSKDDIRQYFCDHVKIKASAAERYAYGAGLTGFRITNAVQEGLLPKALYHASDDPERLVPVFQRPEWMSIVVAGDAGRNQSRGYVCNHVQGVPTSRRVVLPPNWAALLAQTRLK